MRRFDLVVFDVDGTLVVHPRGKTVWEILNRRFIGNDALNKQRFRDFRAGRLAYADWVTLDVSGWRDAGATREEMIAALDELSLVRGAHEALSTLARDGVRLAVISGTLDILLEKLIPDHPFDEVYCNRLRFDDAGRIASWSATPYDMAGKSEALKMIAAREAIPLGRCAFVGDSMNDVWIAREAGFTVAFNPNHAEFESLADVVVRSPDLRDVLPHLLPPKDDPGTS